MMRPSTILLSFSIIVLVFYLLNSSLFLNIIGSSDYDEDQIHLLERKLQQQNRLRDEAERRSSLLQQAKDNLLTQLEMCKGSLEASGIQTFNDSELLHSSRSLILKPLQTPIGVLILTYNRPDYLQKTLEYVFKYLPPENYIVVISQDGNHSATASKIDEWRLRSRKLYHRDILHIQRVDRPDPPTENLKINAQTESYFHISMHYKYALSYMFDTLQLKSAIIIEDDIEISSDFFDYFERFQPLYLQDPTIYCVSAFHDNSRQGLVEDSHAVARTHWFPGLGWMISRAIWYELAPKWPLAYWDDWMRADVQRQGRDCLRPEISRSRTFGVEGASSGSHSTYYNMYGHKPSKISPTSKLTFLGLVSGQDFPIEQLEKDEFDRRFVQRVESALLLSDYQEIENYKNKVLMLLYSTQEQFEELAIRLGLVSEYSAQPRASYYKTIEFHRSENLVLIAPGNIESIVLDIKKRLKIR